MKQTKKITRKQKAKRGLERISKYENKKRKQNGNNK